MKIRVVLPAVAAVAALALTGCVNNSDSEGAGGGSKSPATSDIKADSAAVALLPKDIKDSGKLIIGTDASYPPNEYKDSNGNPTGWNVTLANAIAAKLGLKADWQVSKFDSIIPNINGGKFNMGSSSFTDTLERQKSVDFIDYYQAGTLWAAPKGKTVNPEDACGLKVSVQSGTVQDTDEMPARQKACKDAGKPEIQVLKFDGQEEATNAVVVGKADALSADSPVTLAAIKATGDALQASGESFDNAPYGFVTAKDSELTKAVQAAVESLMKDGTYTKILTDAGVEAGAVKEAVINGGKS